MTTISNTQAAAVYNLPQAQNASRQRAPEEAGQLPPGLQQDVAQIAESEGLSDEDTASLEADLQDALSSLFDSGDSRPDPETVKETVSSVFAEYGLDASQLANSRGPGGGRPPGGPPPGGPPPGGAPPTGGESDSTTETDTDETLVETLQDLLEQLSENGDSETVNKISDLLVSGLLGVDEEA
ncbi:hypothetical protein [Blastopirellula marina]|uniref:Uncharacterized protein n=1 Tax=Blastopirellula marina TaxID=124 RepID=A0A2S8G9J7_9BACT|nr:hypothetical protein [Blastopirellula marina]PQO41099.1 hypothetical protein C5Y98_03840 [Blastopirellula marina]PTL45975.1 hypothetical protein C5Y97_03840 [Blastopirellula marina]